MPEEVLNDDLENAKNNKSILKIVNEELSSYKYELNYTYSNGMYDSMSTNINIEIDNEFSKKDYNKFIELKEKLLTEQKKLSKENKKPTIDHIYIKFNNIEIVYKLDGYVYIDDEDGNYIEIEQLDLSKYQ